MRIILVIGLLLVTCQAQSQTVSVFPQTASGASTAVLTVSISGASFHYSNLLKSWIKISDSAGVRRASAYSTVLNDSTMTVTIDVPPSSDTSTFNLVASIQTIDSVIYQFSGSLTVSPGAGLLDSIVPSYLMPGQSVRVVAFGKNCFFNVSPFRLYYVSVYLVRGGDTVYRGLTDGLYPSEVICWIQLPYLEGGDYDIVLKDTNYPWFNYVGHSLVHIPGVQLSRKSARAGVRFRDTMSTIYTAISSKMAIGLAVEDAAGRTLSNTGGMSAKSDSVLVGEIQTDQKATTGPSNVWLTLKPYNQSLPAVKLRTTLELTSPAWVSFNVDAVQRGDTSMSVTAHNAHFIAGVDTVRTLLIDMDYFDSELYYHHFVLGTELMVLNDTELIAKVEIPGDVVDGFYALSFQEPQTGDIVYGDRALRVAHAPMKNVRQIPQGGITPPTIVHEYLELSAGSEKISNFRAFNVMGQPVLASYDQLGDGVLRWDVRVVPPGPYFYEFSAGSRRMQGRVIVVH